MFFIGVFKVLETTIDSFLSIRNFFLPAFNFKYQKTQFSFVHGFIV